MFAFLNSIGRATTRTVEKTVTNVVTTAPQAIATGIIIGGATYLGQHLMKGQLETTTDNK